jgi:hypothetical protein
MANNEAENNQCGISVIMAAKVVNGVKWRLYVAMA